MEPGFLIGGRFRLLDIVGAGGMGAVYRAQDEREGSLAAVKLTMVGANSSVVARLAHEAELLASLSHKAIVSHRAHGELDGGGAWLAMQWLDGPDVGDLLVSPGLTPGEAVRLALRVAEALGAMHEAGAVHADVKPSNLLAPGGRAEATCLVDLGVARSRLASCPAPRTGVVVGTPGFMAPEQIRDAPLGPPADIFALGCVLFEAIAGRATFEADEPLGLLTRTLLEESPRLDELRGGLPTELVHLVIDMLRKDPEQRPSDGAEAARRLRRVDSILTRTGVRLPWGTEPPGPALTEAERRITSLVLAAPPGTTDADLDVGCTVDSQLIEASIEGLAERFDARVEALPGRAVLASIEGDGDAVGQVTRAGALALELRARMPEAAISLTTGSVERDGARFLGAVIDRAVAAVRAGAPGAVALDDVSAGLVSARFAVTRDASGARLEGARSSVIALRHFAGAPSPCLGRDDELARLEERYASVVDDGRARGVIVRGPAGIGKSRLVSEFVRRRTKEERPPTLWLGAGDPMLRSVPFGPWAQALRRRAGMREGDPPGLARRKLHAEVARNVDEPGTAARHEEFLGALLGALPDADDSSVQWAAAVDDAVLLGDQMRRALEEAIASACRRGPVLVVLEDLPFTDDASRAFAGRLLRNLADAPLMVVGTTNGALGLPGAPEGVVDDLTLGGLPDEASEALVRAALEGVDGPTLRGLVRSAGGNGLLLEEVVRAIRDGREGIPETALAVLQARLEALPKIARRALRAASLFGHSAHRGGIAQLLGGEVAASVLDASLRTLTEEQLLVPTSETHFAGEDAFSFRHALVREAAYAMLTDDDRALGHRLAGQWLEAAGEREPSVLAEHFHAGGLPERANELYVEAARKALSAGDFVGALEHAELALEGGVAGQLRGGLRLVQAEAYRWRGDLGEADRCARQALELLAEGGRPWFGALAEAASASARLGRQQRLVELAAQLRAAWAHVGAEQARALALGRVSSHLCSAGRVEEADALLVLAEDLLGELDGRAPATAARLRRARAQRALVAGDLGAYAEETSHATTGFDRAGDERNGCNERVNLGYVFLELGLDAEAQEALEGARASALRLGLSWTAGAAEHNLGRAYLRRGRLVDAERVERDAIERFREHADRRFEAGSRVYLAQILAAADRHEDGEREACAAVALAQAAAPPLRPYALATLALVQHRAGHLAEAHESAREAAVARDTIEAMEEGEATLHLAQVEVLLAVGEADEARAVLRRATTALTERAAKIGRSDWRRSFLRGVPDHARLLELGAKHGVPGPR